MNRRTHRNFNTPDNFVNGIMNLGNDAYYSDNFRNMYNNMDGLFTETNGKAKSPFNLPNILNFELNSNDTFLNNRPNGKKMDPKDRDSKDRDPKDRDSKDRDSKDRDSKDRDDISQETVAIDSTAGAEKRFGIKKLVNAKSGLIYPFEKPVSNPPSVKSVPYTSASINSAYASSTSNVAYVSNSNSKPYTSSTLTTKKVLPEESPVPTKQNVASEGMSDIMKQYIEQMNKSIEKEALEFKESLVEHEKETPVNVSIKTTNRQINVPINTDNEIPFGFRNHCASNHICCRDEYVTIPKSIETTASEPIETTASEPIETITTYEPIETTTPEPIETVATFEQNVPKGPMKIRTVIDPLTLNNSYMGITNIINDPIREDGIKKIDNKNHDNSIVVEMNNNKDQSTNMSDKRQPLAQPVMENSGSGTIEIPSSEPDNETSSTLSMTPEAKQSVPELKPVNDYKWPELSIDLIGTSFKVIGDLPVGAKLKIVNDTHLAEDNGYMPSFTRYSAGQGRDKIISFLDHLFTETENHIRFVLESIRTGKNVDTNISVLRGLISKINIFLHRYENMRGVYKSDSSAFARLGIIRDKFFTFLDTFFRDMAIPK